MWMEIRIQSAQAFIVLKYVVVVFGIFLIMFSGFCILVYGIQLQNQFIKKYHFLTTILKSWTLYVTVSGRQQQEARWMGRSLQDRQGRQSQEDCRLLVRGDQSECNFFWTVIYIWEQKRMYTLLKINK